MVNRSTSCTDVELLCAVQARTADDRIRTSARVLNKAGEHAGAWLAIAATGAALSRRRREEWLVAGAAVLGSHAASVVLKRVVRRHRPTDPRVQVLVTTPSRWSMPSSHATSTTTAALVFAKVLGTPAPLALIPAMAVSRTVVGVHYPTDVLAGSALGALVAAPALRLIERRRDPR